MSIAEGYDIFANDERFRQLFADFQQRFGIRNVLEGCFYSYPSESDRETFFKRLRQVWIDNYEPSEVMTDLRRIVNGKPYFIITSNADTHLELSGFDADKVFEIEGTFERTGQIDDKSEELQTFIRQYANSNLVVLELGIGSRNRMIKAPLMQLIAQQAGWRYVTLNLAQELFIPQHIADRSIGLAGDNCSHCSSSMSAVFSRELPSIFHESSTCASSHISPVWHRWKSPEPMKNGFASSWRH